MAIINFPVMYIPDPTRGRPLYNGQILVGEPDLDPAVPANQKQLRVMQEDGTLVNVTQPFLLSAGGVPVYAGSYVRLDVDGNFSLKILDSTGSQVYYIENAYEGQPILVEDLPQYVAAEFADVANMKTATALNFANTVDWADYLGREVTTVVNNSTSGKGGASYKIVNVDPSNLSTLVGGVWQGVNHDLGGGFYAELVIKDAEIDVETCGVAEANADNSTAILSAAAALNPIRGVLKLPAYLAPTAPLDLNAYPSIRKIEGHGQGTGLICAAGTYAAMTPVLKWQNIAGRKLHNFEVNCNNQTDVGINTDWTGGAGPSLSNNYNYVWVSGYKNTGWKALNNNDCPFDHVVVRQKGASAIADPIAIDINAAGGFVGLTNCILADGKLKFAAQNLVVNGGFQWGIEAGYSSFNDVILSGAYVYSGNQGACIKGTGSAYIGCLVAPSCHWIVENDGDALIDGTFDTGAEITGGHIAFTHAGTKNIYGASLDGRAGGRNPKIKIRKTTADGAVLNESAASSNVLFEYDNFYIGGGNLANQITSFRANLDAAQSNVTGDGTLVTVIFGSEEYNYNGSYNSSTGIFTAKQKGVLSAKCAIQVSGMDAAHTSMEVKFIRNGGDYDTISINPWAVKIGAGTTQVPASCDIPVEIGDTVLVRVVVSGGTKTVDISNTVRDTWFTGFIV